MDKSLIAKELYKIAKELCAKDNPYIGNGELYNKLMEALPKKIGKYSLYKEHGMGTVFIEFPKNITVWCTPFWEGSKGIEIDVTNPEGDQLYDDNINFPVTGDVERDAKEYGRIMDRELDKIIHTLRHKIQDKCSKYDDIVQRGLPKIAAGEVKITADKVKVGDEIKSFGDKDWRTVTYRYLEKFVDPANTNKVKYYVELKYEDGGKDALDLKDKVTRKTASARTAKTLNNLRFKKAGGWAQFSSHLSDIMQAQVMQNKGKSTAELMKILKSDKLIADQMRREKMSDADLKKYLEDPFIKFIRSR